MHAPSKHPNSTKQAPSAYYFSVLTSLIIRTTSVIKQPVYVNHLVDTSHCTDSSISIALVSMNSCTVSMQQSISGLRSPYRILICVHFETDQKKEIKKQVTNERKKEIKKERIEISLKI